MTNLDTKFKNEKERAEAREYLNQLINSKGWEILSNQLLDEIEVTNTRLTTENFKDVIEVHFLQETIKALKKLKNKPQELIEYLQPNDEKRKKDEEEKQEVY